MSAATPEPPSASTGDAAAREPRLDPAPAAAGASGNGAPTPADERVDWEALGAVVFAYLGEVVRDARTLIDVGSEKARNKLRRARWTLAQWIVLGFFGIAIAIGGAIFVVRGLAGTLTVLFGGRAWLGELATGVLLIVLLSAGVFLARALDERGELERLRREFARRAHEETQAEEEETSDAR